MARRNNAQIMMVNDVLNLRDDLQQVKVKPMTNEQKRKYIGLMRSINRICGEFEEEKDVVIRECAKDRGIEIASMTKEQGDELMKAANPALFDCITKEVDIDTRIFKWDELYDSILGNPENSSVITKTKTNLAELLCSEDV